MIIEKEDIDLNHIYILLNDKIIRFKHWWNGNSEGRIFLEDKGNINDTDPPSLNGSLEKPYISDKQFMKCNNSSKSNNEEIANKAVGSESFFARIKYPTLSEDASLPPQFLNYEYMQSIIDREWIQNDGYTSSRLIDENYRDIYGVRLGANKLNNAPQSNSEWDADVYAHSNSEDEPYKSNNNWWDKPYVPYMYAMNYRNQLMSRTIGLRVHQVYGLSKLKRDGTQSTDGEKDVPKFSFIAVNRDYLVRNQVGSGIKKTKRWKKEKSLYNNQTQHNFRLTYDENDDLYLPETLTDNMEDDLVSGISTMFVVDFSANNDVDPDLTQKRGKLMSADVVFPSTLHEDYYEFLDPVTKEFDSMFLNNSNEGEFSSGLTHASYMNSKINLDISKAITVGYPLTSAISTSDKGILQGGRKRKKASNFFTLNNRSGGKWHQFGISSWFNDLLMIFDKDGNKEYLSTYKSQYLPFSFDVEKTGSIDHYLAFHSVGSVGTWLHNNPQGGILIGNSSWSDMQTNAPDSGKTNKGIASANFLYRWFDHFLVSLRRDFSQRNIMNSLLPKMSKNIGNSIITGVGNWGESLTTNNFSTLPDLFMNLDEFSEQDSEKYQNAHGTLLILGSNFISGTEKDSTVPIHRTKHVHYIDKDNVYKDFIAKPIILERDGRTESHFTIGSSIGYKTLYKESRYNSNLPPDRYAEISPYVRKYNITEFTDNLMSYRLFDQENMIWCSLEDFIEPRIPIFESTDQSVFQSLQQLSSLMDYRFGIKKGVPYFEDKENLFRAKHGTKLTNETSSDYLDLNQQSFEDSGFKLGGYYFMLGEILQIDITEESNGGLKKIHRSVEYSMSSIDSSSKTINSEVVIYDDSTNVIRLSLIGTTDLDVNFYEITSVINEKNLIEVQNYNRMYINDYTDYEITYGDSKSYRRKLNNRQDFKKTFSLDVSQVYDYDWILYLANKIERNVNKLRFNLNISIKFNPNITNGDYIAVYEPINKIGVESVGAEYKVNNKQLKTYKLFKVQSVVHNVQNYTSTINCYSVDVNYSSIKQG